MSTSHKLQQSVKELQRLTGLPLNLELTDDQDEEQMISQITSLLSAYKDANNKELVLRRWMTSDMNETDFLTYAERMHMEAEAKRGLFLIQLHHDIYTEVISVIRNSLPDYNSWIVKNGKDQLILIYHFPRKKALSAKEKAYEILNLLNSELMENATISYTDYIYHLNQLPEAYQNAHLTLQIGSIFFPDRSILNHSELGVGSLLYGISDKVCKDYIRSNLGQQFLEIDSPIFHSDILQTANCFLNNNLNIAETARQLHIHRNTLLYRLEQIQNETGLDIRRFDCAMTYKLCSMVLLYLNNIQ